MTLRSSQIEELRAAVEKLTALKVDSRSGPWTHEPVGGQNQNGDYSGGNVFDDHGEYLLMEVPDADGALIVALHATLDAQLTILQKALADEVMATTHRWFNPRQLTRPGLILARAINGGA